MAKITMLDVKEKGENQRNNGKLLHNLPNNGTQMRWLEKLTAMPEIRNKQENVDAMDPARGRSCQMIKEA
eukprot:scaffold4481_cov121-Cylindrotheca_fusiformis.AAC.14